MNLEHPNAKYLYAIYSPVCGEYAIMVCTISYWNAHKDLTDYSAEDDSEWYDLQKSAKLKGFDCCDYDFNFYIDSFTVNPFNNLNGDPVEFQSRFKPDPEWTTLPEFTAYCQTFIC